MSVKNGNKILKTAGTYINKLLINWDNLLKLILN